MFQVTDSCNYLFSIIINREDTSVNSVLVLLILVCSDSLFVYHFNKISCRFYTVLVLQIIFVLI